MNQGHSVCTTDINMIKIGDSQPMDVSIERGENVGNINVTGRKFFGLAACEEFMYVSSGMDSYGHLISDLWTYNTNHSTWEEINFVDPPANSIEGKRKF